MIKEIFIKNLIALRSKKGLTQAELAGLAEISHRYYVKVEHGQSWPSPENMDAIINALGVSPSALFSDDSKEYQNPVDSDLITIITALPALDQSELRTTLTHINNSLARRSRSNKTSV